jgi:adenine phosphoribosyltransferase
MLIMNLKDYIATIPDYPEPGILFRDITPLMQNGEALHETCAQLIEYVKKVGADVIVGPEARGFIFGCPIAYALHIGFIPIRKPNKLPRETVSLSYKLEYGSNTLCMHKDAIKPGQKVVIIDDLLATGGTVDATAKLVEKVGGIVVGSAFLIELEELHGRERLAKYNVFSILKY